jgi:hypothetical protein
MAGNKYANGSAVAAGATAGAAAGVTAGAAAGVTAGAAAGVTDGVTAGVTVAVLTNDVGLPNGSVDTAVGDNASPVPVPTTGDVPTAKPAPVPYTGDVANEYGLTAVVADGTRPLAAFGAVAKL